VSDKAEVLSISQEKYKYLIIQTWKYNQFITETAVFLMKTFPLLPVCEHFTPFKERHYKKDEVIHDHYTQENFIYIIYSGQAYVI